MPVKQEQAAGRGPGVGWRDDISTVSTDQRENESSLGLYTPKAHLQGCTFSSKAALPKLPSTAPPTGDQEITCLSLWGTFLIQATTEVLLPGTWFSNLAVCDDLMV